MEMMRKASTALMAVMTLLFLNRTSVATAQQLSQTPQSNLAEQATGSPVSDAENSHIPALMAFSLRQGRQTTPSRFKFAATTATAGNAKTTRNTARAKVLANRVRKSGQKTGQKLRLKSRPKTKMRKRWPQSTWSNEQILQAQAQCADLLRGLDVVVTPMAPIKRRACGSPAPMKLVAMGSNPRVTFDPAPTVSCELVAAMHRWLKRDLQPLARKHLKAPLTTIGIMSSYSCRNAYGRRRGKLSQHARANALDIRHFKTSNGVVASLLPHWGTTARQRRARARAVKRRTAAKVANPAHNNEKNRSQKSARATGRKAAKASLIPRGSLFPSWKKSARAKSRSRRTVSTSLFPAPDNLGGPKPKRSSRRSSRVNRSAFLRAIHKTACSIFGTVLGPEANHTHRHHFHVDTQKRKLGPYCR